jgi:carbon-monoxide dehydrogenase iron sulfur subunit
VAHSESHTLTGALAEGAQSRVLVVAAGRTSVPLQCRHCQDAPCVAVCPKSALTQPEPGGVVLPHPEACVACRSCVMVCPFGAVRLGGEDGKALLKCDLCIERLEAGQEPACVEACPTGALLFAEPEGCVAEAYAQAAAEATGPSILVEDEVPEAEAKAEPPAAEGGGKRKPAPVACAVCGDHFNLQAAVKLAAKKLGKRPAYLSVCPRCRRLDYAASLAGQLGACAEVRGEQSGAI